MAAIAWWLGRRFEISPKVIRGFTGLQITGSAETENKTFSSEQWTDFVSAKATEITLTAHLNAYLGCDVKKEAMAFVDDARWGKIDYFYVYQDNNCSKLIPQRLMLTSASVSKVVIAPTGKWISADVQLTMKSRQTSATGSSGGGSGAGGSSSGGSSSGGGGGYSKTSVKTTSTTTSGGSGWLQKVEKNAKDKTAAVKAKVTKQTVSAANKAISQITSTGKKTTVAKKTTTAGGSGKRVAMTK